MICQKFAFTALSALALIALAGCDGNDSATSSKTNNQSKFGAISEVCSYLASQDLTAGEWKNYGSEGEPDFGCNSPYRELGSSEGLPNNLAYYVEGDETQATKLYLVLNVNDAGQAVFAYQALLEAASTLTQKVTQKHLPPDLDTAILAGTRSEFSVGKFKIRTFEETWPTGRGYEIHFEIQ
jgi:hypothetical protein